MFDYIQPLQDFIIFRFCPPRVVAGAFQLPYVQIMLQSLAFCKSQMQRASNSQESPPSTMNGIRAWVYFLVRWTLSRLQIQRGRCVQAGTRDPNINDE